jgi:5-formyltetrahydrofolate cyclo-ligase
MQQQGCVAITVALAVLSFDRLQTHYAACLQITGPASADMRMFPLLSMQHMAAFPLTKWGTPEPSVEEVLAVEDGTTSGCIDLVIAPGCAFDAHCNRLGHGKGYYGM